MNQVDLGAGRSGGAERLLLLIKDGRENSFSPRLYRRSPGFSPFTDKNTDRPVHVADKKRNEQSLRRSAPPPFHKGGLGWVNSVGERCLARRCIDSVYCSIQYGGCRVLSTLPQVWGRAAPTKGSPHEKSRRYSSSTVRLPGSKVGVGSGVGVGVAVGSAVGVPPRLSGAW